MATSLGSIVAQHRISPPDKTAGSGFDPVVPNTTPCRHDCERIDGPQPARVRSKKEEMIATGFEAARKTI
jgi:hypothetical protein